MKKPIHKEIIILQNYFKSMRAKMDGGGGGAGDRLPSLQVSCPMSGHLQGLDSLAPEGRGSPSLLHQGLGKPRARNTEEKQTVDQKSMASEPAGDCRHGFWCPSSQNRRQLAPNSPPPRDGGWQLSFKTTCKTHPSLRAQPRRWTRS